MITNILRTQKRKINLQTIYDNLNALKVIYSRYLVSAALDGVNKRPTVLDVNYDFLVDLGSLDGLVVSRSFKKFNSSDTRYAGDYIANAKHIEYVLKTQKIESKTLKDGLKRIYEVVRILEIIEEYESFLLNCRGGNYKRSVTYQMGVKLLSEVHIGFQNQLPPTLSFITGKGVERKECSLAGVYYNTLTEWFYQSISITDYETWTFHDGFTREEEGEYLELFLEGVVEPTTEIGKNIIKCLWKNEDDLSNQKHSLKQLYKETLQTRLREIEKIKSNLKPGIEIVGCNDYSVYTLDMEKSKYSSETRKQYCSTYGSFVYLEDTGKILTDLEVIGVGGSFKLKKDENTFSIPTELVIDGKVKDGYMLKRQSDLDIESLDYLIIVDEYREVGRVGNKRVDALLGAHEALDVEYITLANDIVKRIKDGEQVLEEYQQYILEEY